MKVLFGVLLMITGICFGLYAGVYWAFVGGIVDIIDAMKQVNTDAMTIAIGIAKIMFAGLIGWASASILLLPGYILFCVGIDE